MTVKELRDQLDGMEDDAIVLVDSLDLQHIRRMEGDRIIINLVSEHHRRELDIGASVMTIPRRRKR